ncbi:MAG: primosomal protein N' [Gammaproteobacteria bacterium]
MPGSPLVIDVAVPSPLRQSFDYYAPPGYDNTALSPGMRVTVPFGRAKVVGIILNVMTMSRIAPERIKPALDVLDQQPLLPADILKLLHWASSYYHYPVGEVVLSALPALLRQGGAAQAHGVTRWRLTATGLAARPESLLRAPRQAALLGLLQAQVEGLSSNQLSAGNWRPVLHKLIEKGWVEGRQTPCLTASTNRVGEADSEASLELNAHQQQAVEAVAAALGSFQAFVLDGVTGSGKTEVYLRLIERVIADGRQALVLVPEIGLTPQLVQRFQQRFQVPVAVLHSSLNDQERLCAWLMARDGSAPIVLGTRSAVFTPLKRPGIFIIDEEHDLSFKQQDGFRYHARDVAVWRAQQAQVPIVLGSATPALESLHNVQQCRYQRLVLPQRAGSAQAPSVSMRDVRHQVLEGGLSTSLLVTMQQHLDKGEQVLLFLNRRGYAPSLICHDCGWLAVCSRCDARMVFYQQQRHLLRCHHCGAQRPLTPQCPDCAGSNLRPLGQGTERVEQVLAQRFPHTGRVRIDRDSTRRKGAMQAMLDGVHDGRSQILIGTQMLAKGHHLPNVTLVGILDADQGLFGMDFRSPERMAQLIVQVTGRAGRSDKPGQVFIQTRHPDHPLLRTLLSKGYAAFAQAALDERRLAELPPYSCMALLRATAVAPAPPQAFLNQARALGLAANRQTLQLLGPVAAPMERRAGRYRAQLLVQAAHRTELQRFLSNWIPQLEGLKMGRKVRWSIDVDPMEMG